MPLLDELSGYDFEDLMEDVFRKLGYENVRQSRRTGDEGRDILMEEVVDGQRRAVVVECKHRDSVSRPTVQKLHSAVSTYEFDGPKRGLVVTTGRFTGPAHEYAEKVRQNSHDNHVELLDGSDLRRIGEEIGLDMRNGRIEVLCDETLRPVDPTVGLEGPVRAAFESVSNLDHSSLPRPTSSVQFRAFLAISAHVDATFETSVGVIHRIDERTRFVVQADVGRPQTPREEVRALVADNLARTVDLDEGGYRETFDEVTVHRFGQTETEYKEWAVDRLRETHTTTVSYTGDNNVTYEKTCTPKLSDVSVQAITSVYLPQIRQTTRLGQYDYPYEYCAAGPSRVTVEDGVHRCVHCETRGTDHDYTFCANCGSVNCAAHVHTERLEDEPVCSGCAVTERFAWKRKYFYDEANLAAFREEYEAMAAHEKAMENPALVAGTVVALVVMLVVLAGALPV